MTSPETPASALGPVLHDLLVREAHLRLARERTKPEWTQKEAELRLLQGTKPPFLIIMPRKKRDDYEARVVAAEKAAVTLRERMEMIERSEPHIRTRIMDEIEKLLREDCPDYIEALAALKQKEDWLRCLERFAQCIFEFTRALGNVRNIACSGYARHTGEYSVGAQQAFQLAYEAAQKVEDEVAFANRIAAKQLEVLAATGVETKSLPMLPVVDYGAWVAKISGLRLAEAQIEFDALIESTKQIHDAGVPELKAQADQVQHEQTEDVSSFLNAAWEQFRADVAPQIFPGDTERSVADTFRMLEAAGRASVAGRM